jgi:uncharacterized membrane protein
MIWFFVAILSYFIFALTAILDKYILHPDGLEPKIYAFYDSIFGILLIFLLFLKEFRIDNQLIIFAVLAGIFKISAIFVFYNALLHFETSRILPTIGGFLPCLTFFFTFLQNPYNITEITFSRFLSFLFLIFGSFLINYEKKKINLPAIMISILASLLFSLYLIFSKILYSNTQFLQGLVWILLSAGLFSLIFLFSKGVKTEILKERKILNKKITLPFLLNKTLAMLGGLAQHYAIFLAPISLLAFINALEGIKYVFILIMTIFLSIKFKNIFKEEIKKEALLIKIISVILIFIGIFIFYYF